MFKNIPIPINVSESIIEPFWDKQINSLLDWEISNTILTDNSTKTNKWWDRISDSIYSNTNNLEIISETNYGLTIEQIWCCVKFSWTKKPKEGHAICMSKKFEMNCTAFDNLILSANIPKVASLTFKCKTDCGNIQKTFSKSNGIKKEYSLDIKSAKNIKEITIIIDAIEEGIGSGSFLWIGLQNIDLLNKYLSTLKKQTKEWYPYLKPEDYIPSFKPYYGFIFDDDNLIELTSLYNEISKKTGLFLYKNEADLAKTMVPEDLISENISIQGDTRYARERDYNNNILDHGLNLAIFAYFNKDSQALRMAARFAMSIAFCNSFDDSFICNTKGSNFEHKAFTQNHISRELILILDLAWDFFTVAGREYILRRISEECLGKINARILKYSEEPENIFAMNQLLFFSEGRLLSYLALEKHYKRTKAFTEIAYNDILESIEKSILSDGGYVEGTSYFSVIGKIAINCIYYYAKQRNLNYFDIIPEKIKKTASLGNALASTAQNQIMIPICDAKDTNITMEYLSLMAAFVPNSLWVNMFWKKFRNNNNLPDNLTTMRILKHIASEIEPPSFISLEEMNIVASHRMYDGFPIKLLVLGNKKGAGHNHEDKGSFVLEFANETFALDAGICLYGNALSNVMGNCERHNMLVPYSSSGKRPHPERPLYHDIKPISSGNATSFSSHIDLSKGWENWYEYWTRDFSSPSLDVLIIEDNYSLINGDGVDFLWNTTLDVEISKNVILIKGTHGKAIVEAPNECELFVDNLPLLDEKIQKRITIRKKERTGKLKIKINFTCY